jgi:hypothetical protein
VSSPAPAPAAVVRHERLLFEDDEILIGHSAHEPAVDRVVVVFDPINFTPDLPPFARDFLLRAGVDTISVRKKRENFYQPLSREAFAHHVGPALAGYGRRFAYGSSLGAYAALYFCGDAVDHVIASSPRVSAHPRFGIPHWQRQIPFLHAALDPERAASCQASVLYDPKDELDRAYIEGEVLPAFPKARVWAVPFSGHPTNQFLSEIGFIAPFVRAVVADTELPPLERRRLKARSSSYRQVLATHCLQRHKPHWAHALAGQALQMNAKHELALRTLGEADLALGRLDAAAASLERFAAMHPTDGHAKRSLAELQRRRQGEAAALGGPQPVTARVAALALAAWRRLSGVWRSRRG